MSGLYVEVTDSEWGLCARLRDSDGNLILYIEDTTIEGKGLIDALMKAGTYDGGYGDTGFWAIPASVMKREDE